MEWKMIKQALAALIFMIPALALADVVGVDVRNASCSADGGALESGGRLNDLVLAAVTAAKGSNWVSSHPGSTIVARFVGNNLQATFNIEITGNITPISSGCVQVDAQAWTGFANVYAGSFSETAAGVDYNGNGNEGDVIVIYEGGFSGTPPWTAPPGNNH